MPFNPQITVDVFDNVGKLIGPGPLKNVLTVIVEEALDLAGRVTLVFPAPDPRVNDLVANERHVQVRTDEGIVAAGIMQEILTDLQPNLLSVAGPDRMGELLYLSTQYNRMYDDLATASIVGTTASGRGLLRETGWIPGSVTPSITPTTITYNSQSVLAALITLASQTGDHFREGSSARTLDYGVFGVDSGVQFINPAQVTYAQSKERNPNLVYINQLQVASISADIENRLYPLGASKFDLRDASNASALILVRGNRGPLGFSTLLVGGHASGVSVLNVTAGTGTNFTPGEDLWIGTAPTWTDPHEVVTILSVTANTITLTGVTVNAYSGGEAVIQRFLFYVEDAASQVVFGERENTPQFGWIKPTDASDSTSRANAADTLYNAVQARLTRYKDTYENVVIPEVFNLPASLRVGQKVRITARMVDQVGGYILNIDALYYVIRIVRTWSGNGRFAASVVVANVSRPAPNNINFVLYNLTTNQWVGVK